MDFAKLLETLAPILGEVGIKRLARELDELGSEAVKPWKKSILALVSNGIEVYGPMGIQMAVDAIIDLLDGKEVVPEWVDLSVGSDILALLQNAEADRKSDTKDFLAKVGKVLGQILDGLIKGLIA